MYKNTDIVVVGGVIGNYSTIRVLAMITKSELPIRLANKKERKKYYSRP